MKSLNSRQVLLFAGGLFLLIAAAFLGWQGLENMGEKQRRCQELTDQLGNEALAAILMDPEGVQKSRKAAKEIKDLKEKLERETGQLRQSWEQSAQIASASDQDWAKDPGKWKDRLIQIQSDMQREAKQVNLKVAPDFYLGFEAYRQKSPSPEEVPSLALELSLAKQLVGHLIDARQRAKEQFPTTCELRVLNLPGTDKESPLSQPGKEGKNVAAGLSRKVFRLEMESSPEVLYILVQNLMRDSGLWIIRDLSISNPKQGFPSRSEISQKFATSKESSEKDGLSPGKLLEILAGGESLAVQLGVEFVVWPKSPHPADLSKGKQP